MDPFEELCQAVEAEAEREERLLKSMVKAAGAIRRSASVGDINALRKSQDQRDRLHEELTAQRSQSSLGARINGAMFEDVLAHHYERELESTARAKGLRADRLDGHLVIGSRIVRVFPERLAIHLDSERSAKLRPSVVLAGIAARGAGKPRYKPSQLVESIRQVYLRMVGPEGDGQPRPLKQIWEALTPLPSARKDYTLSDFVRDVHFLHVSEVRTAKDGANLAFIAPSTAAREGRGFTFYSSSGERFEYYAIEFRGQQP
jgi:hypothetical protein